MLETGEGLGEVLDGLRWLLLAPLPLTPPCLLLLHSPLAPHPSNIWMMFGFC